MKRHVLTLMALLTVSISSAQASEPKTCRELSQLFFTKVLQDFSEGHNPIVNISIPDLNYCKTEQPLQETFGCQVDRCNTPVSVSYTDSDGKCYTKAMTLFYKNDFTDLELSDLAMQPRKCE